MQNKYSRILNTLASRRNTPVDTRSTYDPSTAAPKLPTGIPKSAVGNRPLSTNIPIAPVLQNLGAKPTATPNIMPMPKSGMGMPAAARPNVGMAAAASPGAGVPAAAMPMKKGGKVSSASKRADGIAKKGKTRGRMI
jgi:hypothetical protein